MTHEKSPKHAKPPTDYFDDTDVSENLRGNIVSGSAFVFGSSIIKFLIGIGATAILARLLDPEDYGLLAMVFVVTHFLELFRDMNLSLATVQKKSITHAQVSTIYWINVSICCVISVTIFLLAPAIAWVYDEPRLSGIAALLALPVLVRGFAAQQQALLRRKMRFGALSLVDIGSMSCGYAVAIYLASDGHGYWSLVWHHITVALAFLVMSWTATGWRPGLPARGTGVRSMLVFGSNLTGYSLVRFVSRSLDNALIGWYWGPAPLGIYSRSQSLIGPVTNYLTAPIGSVAFPSLSRLTKDDERYATTFFRLADKILLVVLPATMLLVATTPEIVEILLGPKWVEAGPILRVLSVLIFTEALSGVLNWLFFSQGRGRDLFRFGLIIAVMRIAAVIIGLTWGILGIASALAISALFLQLPIQVFLACRTGPIRQRQVYRMLVHPVVAATLGLIAVLLVQMMASGLGAANTVLIGFCVMASVQLLFLATTRQGRQTLLDIRHGLAVLWLRAVGKT